MNQKTKLVSTATILLFSVTAVVAALVTGVGIETFESEFIQSLKQKFKKFQSQTEQDVVYLQTDKTFYKPNETVWFSAFVRNSETLKNSTHSDIIHIELITPKGSIEKHIKVITKNGIAQGDFDLAQHPGGIYKLKAYTEWQKNDETALLFEKEITIQSVVMPRLKMKLDFEKKAYGKGDEVVAKLELNTNENKPLANTKVKLVAQLNGEQLAQQSATTDAAGKVNLTFKLPTTLNTTDGTVNALIQFEGSTESISRSVPIVLNKIALEFYPEGGDMVNGVASQVAFRALNEFNKAADIEGIIVDSKGTFVTKFSSYHNGMGAVSFTPKANESYKARITKPEGILDEFNLPLALKNGYVLHTELKNNNLQVSINSWQTETLHIVAQTRGKIYFAKSIKAIKGANTLAINTADFPIGVSQITVFDSKGIARAERLAFVNTDKQLNVAITTTKNNYQPREKVTMNIRVTDENGLPVAGNFALSVVDDNLLSFADDKQGTILSKILLEPDLKEKVEEPNFYFDKKEEKATAALDLLMLTSGWRKYTWKQVEEEDFPELKFEGEKTIYSGIVLDGYSYKPITGAVVKLANTSKISTTDKDGRYTLSGFDISLANELSVTFPDFAEQKITLTNYGAKNDVYLYKQRVYTQRPMMARGRAINEDKMMQENEGEVDNIVIANARNVEVKKERKELNKIVLVQYKAALVDVAPVPDVVPVPEPVVVEKNKVEEILADKRFDRLQEFDKQVAAEQNQISFYRAKQFATKKYDATDSTRNDFESTLYWNGNVATDKNGKAKVEFITNDLITSFKTTVEGFGTDGSIGHSEAIFTSIIPFSLDAKIPTELVSGDVIAIPVFIKNNTAETVSGQLQITAPKQLLIATLNSDISIAANQSKLVLVNATAATQIGEGKLEIKFVSPKQNDAITRTIQVIAKGFPATLSLSGQDLQKEFTINPTNIVPGSVKASFTAYPNIMTELMTGVESILREPYGCFEQTSSSNYPNIMVLQYLKSMKIDNPKLQARATKLLDDGYKKLVAFETKENGYEWFGAAPAHEALSAYGLMEFVDMKNVYTGVDDKMIDRTAKLLLEKRDGAGGFKKNPRALDSFGAADEDITNAYIVYALSEAGYKDLDKEVTAVYKEAKKSNDPYLLALCANTLFNVGDKTRAEEIIAQIIKARDNAGFWNAKKHSITRSGGESLKIETTSLILLALLKSQNPDVPSITSAVKFLVGSRSGFGGFGSTQGTILALKSLTKYAEFSKKTDEAGTVEFVVNGKVVAQKEYAKGEQNNITIDGLEKFITAGKQKIEVQYKGCKQALPYAVNIAYSTSLPISSAACVVSLETKLAALTAQVGQTVRLSVTLKNKTAEGQPMTMAIIGIPAGFSAQPWQLKEMQEKGVIDFYETTGNSIACYYRALAPHATKQINLDLKAEVAGTYSAPAASAYLYYTNEHKIWTALPSVTVTP